MGISAADIACGMYAYSGILTALLREGEDGRGSGAGNFPSRFAWGMDELCLVLHFQRIGSGAHRANHATIAPYGPVMSGDNKIVCLGLQNEREWKRFCEIVLENPKLSADPRFDSNARRVQNRPQLDQEMREVFQKLTAAEIIARLEAAQIANARMNTVQEFMEHPQLKARRRWSTVGSPAGPLPALLPP